MYRAQVHRLWGNRRGISKQLFFLFVGSVLAVGAESGKSVVVVYNSALPASKEVAFYYARKRLVPDNQVLSFELPTTETISRDEYRTRLQEPLWKELKKKQLITTSEPANLEAKKINVTA